MRKEFISEDNKTINLPVPLGTVVYSTFTTCGDFCMFQKKLFDKTFEKDQRCDGRHSCHTRAKKPRKMEVTLGNIKWLLENWNIRCFATEEEANKVTIETVERNIKIMKDLGFEMDENNYAIDKRKEDAENE